MQGDASDMPQFLLKCQEIVIFQLIFEGFFYALLHPMSYTLRFCQMKDLIKTIYPIFKVYCIDSASIKRPFFDLLAHISPNIVRYY